MGKGVGEGGGEGGLGSCIVFGISYMPIDPIANWWVLIGQEIDSFCAYRSC